MTNTVKLCVAEGVDNFQRVGSISNTHVGSNFENAAWEIFAS
jgi:hypothetical protein